MIKSNVSIPLEDTEEYLNTTVWEQENNKSTYYDRRLDTQGMVPGCSMQEAEQAFYKEYNIRLEDMRTANIVHSSGTV